MKNTHIKTSVELEVEKVDLAKRLGKTSTLKELLDKALDAYIAQARRHSMAELLGTNFFDSDLKSMRGDRGRSRR
jgi:hypothetical protein